MKYLIGICLFGLLIYGCESSKTTVDTVPQANNEVQDTIRIANDSLDYEIIILDLGFNNWLATQPPRGYYTENFMRNKNIQFVAEFNYRVQNYQQYDPNLYLYPINYEFNKEYGYEVNYMLYNYFLFFQKKYNQILTGGRRIKY